MDPNGGANMKCGVGVRLAPWCACLAVVVFSSCLSMALQPIQVEDVQAFQLNATTRQQITGKYGPPQKTSLTGAIVNACYLDARRIPFELLLVQFDDKGLLVGKNFNDQAAEQECGTIRPPPVEGAGAPTGAGDTGVRAAKTKRCTMDVECGIQSQCSAGVCTGGVYTPIFGTCVAGNGGVKVCTNTGAVCSVDSECHK